MIKGLKHRGLRQLFKDDNPKGLNPEHVRKIRQILSVMVEMKNPPHPGELIGDSLKELGMSVSKAARGLGITRQQLHNVIAGRSAITPEMALRLEKALGSTADMWLRMQMNFDLAQLRGRASSIKIKRFEPDAA